MAPRRMKYVSLTILAILSSMHGISLRHARTKPGDMFLSSTAVVMTELVKLIICLMVVYCEQGSLGKMKKIVVRQPLDTLKVGIPSLLYVIQNNLLYTAASNLDAAVYQVTYQLKILTTAVASILVLKKKLIMTQWFSLVILLTGVITVQLADMPESQATREQNRLLGFLSALAASILSGYAGIFLEKIVKGSDISVWVRNVQLSAFCLPLGLFATLSDFSAIKKNGFFYGYDSFVAYVIILQAAGGLIVAMVLKYADNILKSFATASAIVITYITSVYFFNFVINSQFIMGMALVIFSIYAYNYKPPNRTIIIGNI